MGYIGEDGLYHYGIKGMKWGVRKNRKERESYTLNTKSGDQIRMVRDKTPGLSRAIAKINPKVKETVDNSLFYTIYAPDGKKAGSYQAYLKSPTEFNIVWGDTKAKYQGRGYMSAMMQQGEKIAKAHGRTKITAEVVGDSPDMQHIALDKAGFKKVGEIRTQEVLDTWGGLILVEKDI